MLLRAWRSHGMSREPEGAVPFDPQISSLLSGDLPEPRRRLCADGIVDSSACNAPSGRAVADNLALLSHAVDVWTRGLGYVLIDMPRCARRRPSWSDQWFGARPIACPCDPPPRTASGFLNRWEHGELPTAPGYLASSPTTDRDADDGGARRIGAETIYLFVPIASADEGRALLSTLVFHEKRLLSSLAAHLGVPGARLAVHETAENRRTLRLNKAGVASFGLHAASFGGFVYGTVLALPRFAEVVAAPCRADHASAPQPTRPRRAGFVQLNRATARSAATSGAELGAVDR